jgi:hypothetical protein
VLFRNLGDGALRRRDGADGLRQHALDLAVAAADFDDDGWPDLYLANDYGNEQLFLNRAGQRFEPAVGVGLEESSKSGMAVAVGDILRRRRAGGLRDQHLQARLPVPGQQPARQPPGARTRAAERLGGRAVDCGWAWGAQFGDLNDDGLQDLYVVNGFRSANPKRDYWYSMGKITLGAGQLVQDAHYWPPMEDMSLSGFERSRVLVNGGQLRFVDAAAAVGGQRPVRRTRGGAGRAVGRSGARRGDRQPVGAALGLPQHGRADRHWVRLRLKGRAPNTSAIGARATLERAGGRQSQVVLAGSGFCAQNDLALHFGLGPTRASGA